MKEISDSLKYLISRACNSEANNLDMWYLCEGDNFKGMTPTVGYVSESAKKIFRQQIKELRTVDEYLFPSLKEEEEEYVDEVLSHSGPPANMKGE